MFESLESSSNEHLNRIPSSDLDSLEDSLFTLDEVKECLASDLQDILFKREALGDHPNSHQLRPLIKLIEALKDKADEAKNESQRIIQNIVDLKNLEFGVA